MENKNLIITQNWENDGMLVCQNVKTIKRYKELKEQRSSCDLSKFDMFCAFSNKQFEENRKHIRPLKDGEKYVSFGAGVFGTRDGIEKYLAFSESINKRIAEECDPQEVYCYEFNNYECCIAYDGDTDAIRLVADYWGWEKAREIKRYCVFYPIDFLKGSNVG